MSDLPFSREIDMPGTPCPYCDAVLDAARGLDPDAHPQENDCTVCFYCAQIVIYRADLSLRRPKHGELAALFKAEPKLGRNLRSLAKAIRESDRR